jgi:hypothetical protein
VHRNQNNWLSAPPSEFISTMRMYWPKEKSLSILNLPSKKIA